MPSKIRSGRRTIVTFSDFILNQAMEEPENLTVSPECWTLVASGYVGDKIHWEPGFEALAEVQWILSNLEELGELQKSDWLEIIGDNHCFDDIQHFNFRHFIA